MFKIIMQLNRATMATALKCKAAFMERRLPTRGNEEESFIALNVHACEVSCRAGTIKCSREHQSAALAPIRHAGKSVPPLNPPEWVHSADKNCKSKLVDAILQIKPSENSANAASQMTNDEWAGTSR